MLRFQKKYIVTGVVCATLFITLATYFTFFKKERIVVDTNTVAENPTAQWKTFRSDEHPAAYLETKIPQTWNARFEEGGLGQDSGFRIVTEHSDEYLFLDFGPPDYFKSSLDAYAEEDFRIRKLVPIERSNIQLDNAIAFQMIANYSDKQYFETYIKDVYGKMYVWEMVINKDNKERASDMQKKYDTMLRTFRFSEK